MANDNAKAQSAFAAARLEQEKIVQAEPNYGPALCVLGLIDAGLGRKEEAFAKAAAPLSFFPLEKDAVNGGADMIKYLAMIAAWAGRQRSRLRAACHRCPTVLAPISYGQLKLCPFGTRCAATRASKKSLPLWRQNNLLPIARNNHGCRATPGSAMIAIAENAMFHRS